MVRPGWFRSFVFRIDQYFFLSNLNLCDQHVDRIISVHVYLLSRTDKQIESMICLLLYANLTEVLLS